jgi:hypothetical protein
MVTVDQFVAHRVGHDWPGGRLNVLARRRQGSGNRPSPAARTPRPGTLLVTDEHPARAQLVACGHRSGGRAIHAPEVERTRSPTAGMNRG